MEQKTISELRNLTTINLTEVFYSTDNGQEGFWKFDPADTTSADNTGTVLTDSPATYRLKRVIKDAIKPEWFGTIDGTDDAGLLQQAINVSEALKAQGLSCPVTSSYNQFLLKQTVSVPSLSLIRMKGITLVAHQDGIFTDNVMLNITGGDAEDYTYTDITVDGADRLNGLTGIALSNTGASGSGYSFFVKNLATGVRVSGNVENQKINLGAAYCSVALHEEALTGTEAPGKNYYHISGSDCGTWFYQKGDASSQAVFNCGTTLEDATDYAVVIEGNGNARLMGEIRDSINGGIRINALTTDSEDNQIPGDALNVQLDITVISVGSEPALYAEKCRSITGSLVTENTLAGAVYLGDVAYGSLLDLNLKGIAGGPALQLGDAGHTFAAGRINLAAGPLLDASHILLIENADMAQVNIITIDASSTGVEINGAATNCTVEVNSQFIKNDLYFNTNQDVTTIINGPLNLADLMAYTTPQGGMRAHTVANMGYSTMIYDGTGWV